MQRQQQENNMHRSRAAKFFILGLIIFPVATALADGDATKGAAVFKKCAACDAADKPQNKTGPHLVGIVGRTVASVEGYAYSTGMLEFAKTATIWDEASLEGYLADPRKTVSGTKMAFPPMKKMEERADVIAYLRSLSAP
jgi:cytochrome c